MHPNACTSARGCMPCWKYFSVTITVPSHFAIIWFLISEIQGKIVMDILFIMSTSLLSATFFKYALQLTLVVIET